MGAARGLARIGTALTRRLVVLAALALVAAGPALAESRVALVIGNGAYQAVPALANPPNDARDVAEALKSLGFSVTLGVDLDQAQMRARHRRIRRCAPPSADVSLFYYGGHGLQVSPTITSFPVDARLHTVDDIDEAHHPSRRRARRAGQGRRHSSRVSRRLPQRSARGSHSALKSAGLARVGEAAGLLIAFATQPDAVAYDGGGRNSPFAQSLLGHLATPGVDISSMMIAVRRDVIASTGGAQIPWESSSLTRQFYFAGDAGVEASPETLLWRLAGAQRDPNLLAIYLDRYPEGSHAADVRALLAELGKSGLPPRPAAANANVDDLLWSSGAQRAAEPARRISISRAIPPARTLTRPKSCSPACATRYGSGFRARASFASAWRPIPTTRPRARRGSIWPISTERRRRDRRLRRGGEAHPEISALRGAAGARDRRRRTPRRSL